MFNEMQPAYTVRADGKLFLNMAGVNTLARYEKALKSKQVLDISRAGAILARLFMRHHWIDCLTLSLSATPARNYQGTYFRSVTYEVSALHAVPQQALPLDLFPTGNFDVVVAENFIYEELIDDNYDLYRGLARQDLNGYASAAVTLERDAIAPLLQQRPIDGYLAAIAWGFAS